MGGSVSGSKKETLGLQIPICEAQKLPKQEPYTRFIFLRCVLGFLNKLEILGITLEQGSPIPRSVDRHQAVWHARNRASQISEATEKPLSMDRSLVPKRLRAAAIENQILLLDK